MPRKLLLRRKILTGTFIIHGSHQLLYVHHEPPISAEKDDRTVFDAECGSYAAGRPYPMGSKGRRW